MKYYSQPENRIIETAELISKYGTASHIPQLGIYELTEQPSYTPAGYNLVGDKYQPLQSYATVVANCVAALVASGMTEAQAYAAIA